MIRSLMLYAQANGSAVLRVHKSTHPTRAQYEFFPFSFFSLYAQDQIRIVKNLNLTALTGMDFVAGCPKGYQPNPDLTKKAKEIAKKNRCTVSVVEDPKVAAKEADVLYTDVWVSMGEEDEAAQRERVFKPYQINSDLVALTDNDSIVMHCMPAHRGMEISAEIIDGDRSVVFDEAENRLHAQKAIILTLIGQPI